MINYSKIRRTIELLNEKLPAELKRRPILMEEIFSKLKQELRDVELRKVELTAGNAGFLFVPAEGSPIIGVNMNEQETRRNFTMAHELGHLLLHVPENSKSPSSFIDKDFIVLNRNVDSKSGINIQEVEANFFAAELLMPAEQLYSDFSIEMQTSNTTDVIEKLAKIYNVSDKAMNFRLSNLGFLVEQSKRRN